MALPQGSWTHTGIGHHHPATSVPYLIPAPCPSVPPHLSLPFPLLSPALAHPQLLPCPGDDDGDGLVQRGQGIGVSGGAEHGQVPQEAPSASQEWGDAVWLRLQPDLSRQRLPTLPRSKSLPASCRQRAARRAPRRLLNGFYGGI